MKTFTLYGADHKVGVTMLAQSIAETLALTMPNRQIALLHFDGCAGTDYTNLCFASGLDDLKAALMSKVLTGAEIKAACAVGSNMPNLYQLSGIRQYATRREFRPEHVKQLLELLATEGIDIALTDAGSNWELGLSIGALQHSSYNFLVTTQQTSAQNKYLEVHQQMFSQMGIRFDYLLLNQYYSHLQLKNIHAVLETYQLTAGEHISYLDYGWQAEKERESLLCYKQTEYRQCIERIAKHMCQLSGHDSEFTAVENQTKKRLHIFGGRKKLEGGGNGAQTTI